MRLVGLCIFGRFESVWGVGGVEVRRRERPLRT